MYEDTNIAKELGLLSELLCCVHGSLRRVVPLGAHPNHYKITFAITYTIPVAQICLWHLTNQFSIPDAVSKNHSALVSATQYPSIV